MPTHLNSSRRRWLPAAVLFSGLTVTLAGTVPASAETPAQASARLRQAVKPAGIIEHLRNFDSIAAANEGTRASGLPGYRESRDYVVQRLRAAGYKPHVQTFEFPFFRELSPATLRQVSPDTTTYSATEDFATMTYSGPGEVTGRVVLVDSELTPTDSSTSGCEESDFDGFPAGSVALIQRGSCNFSVKAANAEDAGAVAAIIFNRGTEGSTGPIAGTLGAPQSLPVVGASFAVGRDLADPDSTTVELVTDTESEIRDTWNVTAETRAGNRDNVVMAGAHLDSVPEGAGINDNGSGSAVLLEIAEAARNAKPRNQVRFAWWGAEELGLLGAEHYVTDLKANNPGALGDIRMYLNFDMVGSPNYARFIYDGDNSKFPVGPAAAEGPAGSDAIERTFTRYFASQGLASAETPFSGRSDYGPFIAEGIPAGGLFTGAEGVKTEEEQEMFGGQAGVAYDKCYHQACDTFANVNRKAIDEMSDAVAHAVATYAMSTRSLGAERRAAADKRTVRKSLAKVRDAELHAHSGAAK